MPIISLNGVSKFYEIDGRTITAVADANIDIEAGDIFGIIGYSGAGKSTLIRMLNGLEAPSRGSVIVNGLDLATATGARLARARLKIGMIFQHFNLLWSRTVRENIAFALEIAGASRATIRTRVDELIALVGLQGRENAYPAQLSGGQKQRVGIARALANKPDVLLCDEATSALDPQTTDSILDLLLDVNRTLGLTIVLITHEMHVVRRICNRVAVMEAGRVVEEGSTAEVFAFPKEQITKRFVQQLRGGEPVENLNLAAASVEGGTLVRLVYDGAQYAQPLIAEAAGQTNIPFSILNGQINHLRNEIFGELQVHIAAEGEDLAGFLAPLKGKGVSIEILTVR